MFPFWLILGGILILLGLFNKPVLRLLGIKTKSEVLTTPNLKHSAVSREQIERWLVIALGASFFIQGLIGVLPGKVSATISFALLGICGLLFCVMLGITIANWKAK